jgi:hypothetical protein
VSIEVTLECGCSIESIRAFAEQMRAQRGWAVATSSGWGSSGALGGTRTYSLRARRTSLS